MTAKAATITGLRAKMTFAGRKFHAWWEGYAFDDSAELAALQTKFPLSSGASAPDEIIAEAIWGEGRLEPGSPVWTMRFARLLSLPVRAHVVLFGAGAGAPLTDLKHGTRWKLSGLTRAENFAKGDLRSYSTALQKIQKTSAAGALSFFELHQDADPGAFLRLASDVLAPGAKAVFVDYTVARKGVRLRSCFPSVRHGGPKTQNEYLAAFRDAGFSVAEASDETAAYLPLVAQGWTSWREEYAAISNIDNVRMRAELMREMASQAHMWAERLDAMKSGQLQATCFQLIRN